MSYTAKVTELVYIEPARNHNKFYRAYFISNDDASDNRVVFQWGRRGSKGQSQALHFGSDKAAAITAFNGKLDDKQRSGYDNSYTNTLEVVPEDLLTLASVDVAKGAPQSADRFAVFGAEIDRARRLAMGDESDQANAVTARASLREQLQALKAQVDNAEGQLEVVEMLLMAKLTEVG